MIEGIFLNRATLGSVGVEAGLIVPTRYARGASTCHAGIRMMSQGTWRLLCSSLLGMTCFLARGCNVPSKKELHRSLQIFLPIPRAPHGPK